MTRESPLSARAYALTLIVLTVGLFAAVAVANVVIDPQGIFGTGVLHEHANANIRYVRFVAYSRNASALDGVFFASSRGDAIPLDALAQGLQVDKMANFSVAYGVMSDHLPVLEYVLKDKASRGERLKAVFLLLDPDLFGTPPITNAWINGYLHPAVTGENPARFWLRSLTAVQFAGWWSDLERWRRSASRPGGNTLAQPAAGGTGANMTVPPAEIARAGQPLLHLNRATTRPDWANQLAQLKRFVDLCHDNGIRLVVAISPLRRENVARFEPGDRDATVDELRRIVPVWDFGSPDWLSSRPDLWVDGSHFTTTVGLMMLERIFRGSAKGAPPDFGTMKAPG